MTATTYGRKGGIGPTYGKKAISYQITMPDGSTKIKRVFNDYGETALATGFSGADGKAPCLVVWPERPAWNGDLGLLIAKRMP